MAKTKIILNRQSDLILNSAQIVQPVGIVKSDLPGLVDDLSSLGTAIDAEESSRIAAISSEETARIAADSGLSSEISVERVRINTILSGSDVNLNQFKEVVDFVNSIDLANDNALLAAVTDITSDLTAESARALAAESTLTTDLSSEVSARISAVSDEESARIAGDNSLASDLADEMSARIAADDQLSSDLADLQTYVDTTVNSAISTLTSDLTDETSARIADVNAEETRALAAEAALQSAIDAETAARIAADETLDDKIADIISNSNAPIVDSFTEMVASLEAEITRAEAAEMEISINLTEEETRALAAEVVLQDAIDAEETRATAAEAVLQAAIDAETAARIAADETLDDKIADIISNTNAPIVDSFTEMVASLDTEIARAEAAEDVLTNNLDAEVTRATDAEAALDAAKLNLAGGTMSGAIDMNGNSINDVNNITANNTTSGTVSVNNLFDLDAGAIYFGNNLDGDNAQTIINLPLPTNGGDAANKAYVDAQALRIDAILEGSDVDLNQFKEVVDFVQSIDLSNDEALMNAMINIETSIAQETADRETADSVIEDIISTLDQTLTSNISTLTSTLDTEISERISAIDSVESSISDLSDSLDSSVITINDSINGVSIDLSDEVIRATAAETLLQSNIDDQALRITTILEGSDVDLNQFKEVVDFVNSIDLTNDEALMNAMINIEDSIAQETSSRESADLVIEDMISSLDLSLSSNMSILTNTVDTEIADRISAIETVETSISDLTTTLDASIMTINDSINGVASDVSAEEARAIAAETALQTSINTQAEAISAILEGSDVDLNQFREVVAFVESIDLTNDEALMNAVVNIETSISQETGDREAADSVISDTISSLDQTLTSNISTLTSTLDTEIADRISAIESVEDAISDVSDSLDSSVIFINDSINGKLDVTGGYMTGDINMSGGYNINNAFRVNADGINTNKLNSPNNNIELAVPLNTQGNAITNLPAPTNGGDAANKTYVDSADATLQSNIDEQAAKIEAILEGSDVDLNQFREVVAFVESIDLTNDDALLTAITNINSAIDSEVADRVADVDAEEARAIAAEAALDAAKLNLAGGTMSGGINMAENTIDNVSVLTTNDFYTNGIASKAVGGEVYLLSPVNANGNSIVSLPAPTNDGDAANKLYVDTESTRALAAEAAKLNLAGGTMTGGINLGGNAISDIYELYSQYIYTKGLRALVGSNIFLSDNLDAGEYRRVINLPAPINGGDATNKTYVDAVDAQLSSDLADLQTYVDTTVDSAITTLTTDLATETAARIADVDAEEARAIAAEGVLDAALDAYKLSTDSTISQVHSLHTAAEGVLQSNITAEANERAAEDITLQGNIDIEATRAQAAETAIASDLGTETAARIAGDSAEEARATAAEFLLTSNLSNEVSRATAAEGVLQSNIDTETARIDAILVGASANADNFAKIVTLINSVDTENDTAFASYVLANDAALSAEVTRATTAEGVLSTDLTTEVTRATAAEGVLTTDLATEVTRATAADATLTAAISAEEVSRIAGDSALQSSLNNEIADRIAAAQAAQVAIGAEVTRATAAEGVLTSAVSAEIARAEAAESVLTTNLATEVTARGVADSELSNRISPMEEILEFKKEFIYENNAQVFANGQPGLEDAQLRDGWYYQNTVAGQKINWYFFDGVNHANIALGNFSAYAVMTFDSDASSPILSVYTMPTGSGDVIPGFAHSSLAYGNLNATPVVGKKYLVYFGQNPTINPELPRIQLSLSVGSSNGDMNPLERVSTAAFGSNSGAAVNNVKFMVESVGVYSPDFKGEAKLRIRKASFTNLATEVARAQAAELILTNDFANIYSKKVAITGTPNGVLTTFTLALPVRIGSEMIYISGLLMEEGADYTTIITSGKVTGVEFLDAPSTEMKVRAYGVCGI
jgi:hypothetical protein